MLIQLSELLIEANLYLLGQNQNLRKDLPCSWVNYDGRLLQIASLNQCVIFRQATFHASRSYVPIATFSAYPTVPHN